MMAGIHHMEQLGFGDTQHFELLPLGTGVVSQEECSSSDPETNCDLEQDLQHIHNSYNALQEMVDIGMPVVLNPEVLMCGTNLHVEPQLTFSSDGLKIEYVDSDSGQDLFWEISDIISIDSKWIQMVQSALITLHVRSSAETVNSGPVKVEFCLADPQWEWKQQKIWQLDSRYQEAWKNIESDDFASQNWSTDPSLCFPEQYFCGIGDFEEFTYPKGDREAVSISSRDVELLLPEIFVNDTIIDFYIKHLSTRIEPTERSRYHFFNSFFFRKLADLDKDQEKAPKGREAFLCVRKWTRKIDIFAKDFLFIPVNFSLHWSLLVICYPGEVDTFNKDGDARVAGKLPCIMHMNSIKGTHSGLKDVIQSYLWEEWKERHPESASDSSDKFLNLRFLSLELGDDWFVPAEASLKRSVIRKLIHELVTEPSKTYPKLVCGDEKHDISHHKSEKAMVEPPREYLAQGHCAAEPDSVCRILGAHQQSKLICFNNSEKGLSVPGCIFETEGFSVVGQQEMQVCPSDDDVVVCSPSQDAKNDICDLSEDTRSVMIDDMNNSVAECSSERSTLEALDPGSVEDGTKAEKTTKTAGTINDSEQYVSSESRDGNSGSIMSSGSAVSCGLKEENVACGRTNGTSEPHADGEDTCQKLATGDVAPCEDDTTCTNAEIQHVNGISTSSAKDETYSEKATSNAERPLLGSTFEDKSILVSDDMCLLKGVQFTDIKGSTKEETSTISDKVNDSTQDASSESRNGNTDNNIAVESTQGTDADGHALVAFPCEVGIDAEMPPHVDVTCSSKDENKSTSDSVCEAKNMKVSEDFRSTSEDDIIEGSTKKETDTAADKMNGVGSGSEKHDVSSEANNEICCVGAKRPFPDGSTCEAKRMQACEDFRSTSEEDIIEGSAKEETDTAAGKLNGSEQDASHDSEDGNTDWAGSDSEHDATSKAKTEKCCMGAKRSFSDSSIHEAMEMVTFDKKFWKVHSERVGGRFGRWYKRRIVWKRRKVISRTPPSSPESASLYWPCR
ncbi:uncharacterized protein [Lolium perenne]|uniref:uncharacterized protein isoform X4 n=1 Tax=Lolium perenne TaxID=4522 RepID=UPI0021F62A23|nr:uncharacterized protein LOC127344134 isoform X4 [Lolium perenne]